MPSSLFDYVDGPIHPMGALSEADFCKLARIDCGRFPDSVCCGGGVDPLETECRIVGDANIEKQNLCRIWWTQNACAYTGSRRAGTIGVSCPPKPQPPTPPQPPKPPTGPLCNPASVGKRFSFNFPSGKKWTLSQKDDASARVFYCGGIAEVIPEVQPFVPTGPGKCPDGSDAFSVRGQWKCPSGEGERCGGMGGDRCGSGLECYYENPLSPLMDAPGKCRRIK